MTERELMHKLEALATEAAANGYFHVGVCVLNTASALQTGTVGELARLSLGHIRSVAGAAPPEEAWPEQIGG
jgi:hypothetical protein